MARTVKRLPAMQESQVQFLGREDPLEKAVAPHSGTLAWKIPCTEEPDRLCGSAAAAAAKSLQSCLTLCDPIDGSPPGSAVPGPKHIWSGTPLPLEPLPTGFHWATESRALLRLSPCCPDSQGNCDSLFLGTLYCFSSIFSL